MMRFVPIVLLSITAMVAGAQSPATDVFLMPGSDIVRPGNVPRVNLNIGIGRSFGSNEVTAAYTYENAGSHGFWHTKQGAHTESVGLMRNFIDDQRYGAYVWAQTGITSFTGKKVQNRLYTGVSLGVTYHFTYHSGLWLQETYNKINTTPWYTSMNVGYVFTF